jgi:predicted RND superfamily exporter protein
VKDLPAGLQGVVLAGEPVMVVEGFDMLEKDGRRLWLWSTIMLAVTVVVCFFSFRWLIAPLAVVNWALLLTQATLVWLQLELTMVSSMLSAIITVVGVASVVHLIVRCRELEAEGVAKYTAFRTSILALAIPIAGAIATDVGGFGSLWSAKVGPVQDFGTMMFIGSLMVIPAISLLLPAISLLWVKKPAAGDAAVASAAAAHTSWIDRKLHTGLSSLLQFLRARQVAAGIVISLFAVFIAFGALRLDVETDFTRNFRSDSEVVKSYEFVETRLGGAGVWDVMIPAPRKLDDAYLERVRKLQTRLRAIEVPATDKEAARPGLTKVISLVDALDVIKVDGLLAIVPLTIDFKIQKMMEELPVFTAALRSVPDDAKEPSRLRIMLRARERQSAEQKRWLIEQVRTIALEEFPLAAKDNDPRAGAEVTGFFVLLTSLIESMLRDQWMTFAVATAAMGFIMLVIFRSFKLAVIGIVPNVVPIFLVMGLIGWIGLRINMGAAMIAAVSMGLSVDSSIHYLDTFLHARRLGKSVADALAEVQSSVGRAMLFTTLTLDLGFLVLCTSEFIPTVYFGALVSLAMIGGLAGNLIILPLLLGWFVKDELPRPGTPGRGPG